MQISCRRPPVLPRGLIALSCLTGFPGNRSNIKLKIESSKFGDGQVSMHEVDRESYCRGWMTSVSAKTRVGYAQTSAMKIRLSTDFTSSGRYKKAGKKTASGRKRAFDPFLSFPGSVL